MMVFYKSINFIGKALYRPIWPLETTKRSVFLVFLNVTMDLIYIFLIKPQIIAINCCAKRI